MADTNARGLVLTAFATLFAPVTLRSTYLPKEVPSTTPIVMSTTLPAVPRLIDQSQCDIKH